MSWYWDLRRGVAVRAEDRGPGGQVLGPYDTKEEAENWQARVEARNEEWDDADAEWRDAGSETSEEPDDDRADS